jgi:hypothetical protein
VEKQKKKNKFSNRGLPHAFFIQPFNLKPFYPHCAALVAEVGFEKVKLQALAGVFMASQNPCW